MALKLELDEDRARSGVLNESGCGNVKSCCSTEVEEVEVLPLRTVGGVFTGLKKADIGDMPAVLMPASFFRAFSPFSTLPFPRTLRCLLPWV
jgi:hypothetical protein